MPLANESAPQLARGFATLLLEADERRAVAFLGVFDTVVAMGGLISSDVVIKQGARTNACRARCTSTPSTRTAWPSRRR